MFHPGKKKKVFIEGIGEMDWSDLDEATQDKILVEQQQELSKYQKGPSLERKVSELKKKKISQKLKGDKGLNLSENTKDYLAEKGVGLASDAILGEESVEGGVLKSGMEGWFASGGNPYIAVGAAVLGGLAGLDAQKAKRKMAAAKLEVQAIEARAEGGERKLAAMQKMKGALRSSLYRPSGRRVMSRRK